MKKKFLVIIDMQNDFINGSLGSKYAEEAVLPGVKRKIAEKKYDYLILTQDTHGADYLQTLEGKRLPVMHCIEGTHGHLIHEEIISILPSSYSIIKKCTFGSISTLPESIQKTLLENSIAKDDFEIEICGLCTDICVVSNALILRAAFPGTIITLDSSCCGGTTKKAHNAALVAMQSCQIDVI